jgi:hypothetical protein
MRGNAANSPTGIRCRLDKKVVTPGTPKNFYKKNQPDEMIFVHCNAADYCSRYS